jgi:hypothetical protein
MNTFAVRLFLAVIAGVVVLSPSADADAPAGRYTTAGGTVYDTKTKLTWQQLVPTTTYAWADAKTYCASPAVSTALGGSGWRLPTYKELLTIVDYSQSGPAIDPIAFPGTPSDWFWSSTPYASSSGSAWRVDFSDGSARHYGVGISYRVRCVR